MQEEAKTDGCTSRAVSYGLAAYYMGYWAILQDIASVYKYLPCLRLGQYSCNNLPYCLISHTIRYRYTPIGHGLYYTHVCTMLNIDEVYMQYKPAIVIAR